MNTYPIEFEKYKGKVTVAKATLLLEVPRGRLFGEFQQYYFDLVEDSGDRIEFSLFKDAKGQWSNHFLLPMNRGIGKTLERIAKSELEKMAI